MAGPIGLQQLLRMQGLEWGDSANGDTHLWFDGGTIYTDGLSVTNYQIAGKNGIQGQANSNNLNFNSLTQDYAGVICAFDGATNTDTGAFSYTGKLRGTMGHINIQSVGATLTKVEAVAGVVNALAGSTGTVTDGYGVSGEILHNSGLTFTTIRGTTGTVQILSSGNVGTAYGTDNGVVTTLGQTGTVTVQADGARNYVSVASVVTVGAMTGAENFVQFTAAGTVTGDAVGSFSYFQNGSVTATVSGNIYAAHDEVLLSGAVVTSGTVYGTFAHVFVAGTTVGGTTNAALNAEIQWGSTANPAQLVVAGQFRYRVSAAAVVANGEAIRISSPVIANGGTFTAARGIRIANQGNAGITTSEAIRIDAQSLSGTNYAIISLGGIISLSSTGGSALFTSASAALTVSTTTSGTLAITSAGALNLTGTSFSVPTITTYNSIAVGGNGVPSLVRVTRPAQQVNATVTLATYTTPAADGSYEIEANINVTVSTTVTMTVTCSYTDEANVARVLTLPFFLLAGTLVQSITTAQGNIAYSSMPITIRAKASTAIVIATAGTVTAVTYTGEGTIKQVS